MNPQELLRQGNQLHQQGQLLEADAIYRQIDQLVPNNPHVLQLLGVVALQSGRACEAVRRLKQAIQLDSNQAEYFSNLGLALAQLRQFDQAVAAFDRAIQLQPSNPTFYFNLGIALQANKKLSDAFRAYEKAHELDPNALDFLSSWIHIKQHLCDWENLEELCKPLVEVFQHARPADSPEEVSPFCFLSLPVPTPPLHQLHCAEKWVQKGSPFAASPHHPKLVKRNGRIRIAYMSADFRDHPVGWLLPGILKHHDRSQFEVFGYSLRPPEDTAIHRELMQAFEHRREFYAIDGQTAIEQIAEDQIDILLDLQGHTQEARLDILSGHPARIQVNYLGYPGTMGASFIDYMLADPFVIPETSRSNYRERLVILPHSFLPPAQEPVGSDIHLSRADVGLPDDAIVLCGFSTHYKITPAVFDVWLRVLKKSPQCILWLREGVDAATRNLTRRASQFGIESKRLIFAPRVSRAMHLARQKLADLFLDTFPYNQHSTAGDALRMGVPVVAYTGESMASRVTGSLLHALQMNELIASSAAEYEEKIQRLVDRSDERMAIKARLIDLISTSPVFAIEQYTRNLEQAFLAIRNSIQEPEIRTLSFLLPTTDPMNNDEIKRAFEYHRNGQWSDAIAAYQRLIPNYPTLAELPFNLGTILHSRGDLESGERLYRQAIAIRPEFAEAWNNLGNICRTQGRFEDARQAFICAIQYRPSYAEAFNNLGGLYESISDWNNALIAYSESLQLRPDFAEPYHNLAHVYWRLDKADEAIDASRKAIRLAPQFVEAHLRLGDLLDATQRWEEALTAFLNATKLRPDLSQAWYGVGKTCQLLGRLPDAVAAYQRVIQLDPQSAVAYNDLAAIFQKTLQLDQAKRFYAQALALDPSNYMTHFNLGGCCVVANDLEGSLESLSRTIALKPDFFPARMLLVQQKQSICDWSDIERQSQDLIEAAERDFGSVPITPFAFVGLPIPSTPEQQLRCAVKWSQTYSNSAAPLYRNPPRSSELQKRIRVGYLSADFRSHSVAFMIPELFESHDRTRFEIFGYSLCNDDQSPIRRRLNAGVDNMRPLTTLSHRQAAEQIAADAIDILVDLQGYTHHSRPEILALRPAPIQMSYLGYPGTMGANFIDYQLVDDYVVPSDQQVHFTEKLVYIPGCYQVNDRHHSVATERPTRSQCELPEDGFVFCSFNNTYKFNPAMFDLWMRLLQHVPKSVLWLAAPSRLAQENLQREAMKRGMSSERLVFARQLPIEQHLVRQPLADLFLDTFPYNAHATASIALRMGVPLVTYSGETLSTRVAGSLLRALGMNDLITNNFDEYEAKALQLASHPTELQEVRERLRRSLETSHLFDGARFARHLEQAYFAMWARFQRGDPPASIRIEHSP